MDLAQTALQRCLNSPYLWKDESRPSQAAGELATARQFLEQAARSFAEADEATGLKEAWAAIFRATRALVYRAGYMAEQLRCMEVVLSAHYPSVSADDIAAMRRAQELAGPPAAAMERARAFVDKAASLVG